MKYFLLFYEVVEEFAKKREPYRAKHLGLIDDAHGRGELLLAGAYGDPPGGAALLFRAESATSFAALRKPIRTSPAASFRAGACIHGTS